MGARRSGSDSRCCQPDAAPFEWIDFVDHSHPSVTDLKQWLNGLAPFAKAHEEGEIDALLEKAANGELLDSGDAKTPIKPIRRDPEVFELRKKALNKNLRLYHGEPHEIPHGMVALHRHIKADKDSQQVEIDFAASRYAAGRPTLWKWSTDFR